MLVDTSFNREPGEVRLYQESILTRRGDAVPIIYCTIMPTIASGLVDVGIPALLKPFDLDDLLEMLAMVCPRR